MRFVCLTVICGLVSFSACGQAKGQPVTYSVSQLRQEVRFLQKALQEAHPSLYWYTPKKEIDSAFLQATHQIKKPLTRRQFYQIMAPVITRVRCGHTYLVMPPGEDPPVAYLPFDLWLDQNRLYVVNNKSSDSTIRAGDEITHINGYSVEVITQKGRSIQAADGYNQTFKQHILNWHLLEDVAWEYFGNQEPFQLTIVAANGQSKLHSVYRKVRPTVAPDSTIHPPKAISEAEKQAALDRQQTQELEKSRSLRLLSEAPATALLTINGFGYDDAKTFHQAVFRQLQAHNIQHLIIDLRQNPGGNIVSAADLMSYLMAAPFRIVGDTWAKLRHPNAPSFSHYFDKTTKQLLADNTTYRRQAGSRFYFTTGGSGWHQAQQNCAFRGQVYLLTSGYTFSAGALLAAALKAQRSVVVIGQETGGGQAGCSGSINQTLRLPITQLWLKFPLFRVPSVSTEANRGRGLMPDYAVEYRWQHKQANRDLELEKALELIKGQSR